MKLEGYECLTGFVVPNYWYEEGDEHEHFWVDSQNLWYYKFCEWATENGIEDEEGNPILDEDGKPKKDPRKWYIIAPYKPVGTKVTEENSKEVVKWLVELCYMDNKNKRYEFYEWDFDKHCIKE